MSELVSLSMVLLMNTILNQNLLSEAPKLVIHLDQGENLSGKGLHAAGGRK